MTEETIVVPQTFFDRPIKDILQSEEFLQWGRQQFFRLHQKYIDILPKGSEKNGVVLRVGLKRKKSKSDDVEVQWMAFVKNFESSRKEWYYFSRSKSLPPFCTHSFRDILTSVADTTAKHPTRSFYNNVTSVLGRFVPDMAETRPYYVDRDMMANYVVVPSREGDTYRYNNDGRLYRHIRIGTS